MNDIKNKIRLAYERGEGTFQHLSDKYNVKLGTIKSWSKKDKDSGNQWIKPSTRAKNQNKKVEIGKDEISWIDIENEYVTDIRRNPCSLEDLSKKYNIPLQSVKNYSASHKWSGKRTEYKRDLNQKIREKSEELVIMDAAKTVAKHFKISDIILDEIEKALGSPDELYKIVEKLKTGYGPGKFSEEIVTQTMDSINDGKVLNLVNALDKIQKMQRQTLGVIDADTKEKLDIEHRKMELAEKQSAEIDDDIEYSVEDGEDENSIND